MSPTAEAAVAKRFDSRRVAVESSPLDPLTLLKNVVSLQRLIEMYPPGHPTITDKLREMVGSVEAHQRTNASAEIDIIHDEIYLNGNSCGYERQATAPVIASLAEAGVNSVHIQPGVQPDEFLAASECLSGRRGRGDSIERQLAERQVRHITLKKLVLLDTSWRMKKWSDSPAPPLETAHAEALSVAQEIFENLESGGPIKQVAVTDLVQLLMGQVAQNGVALGRILAVKEYENLTYCHSVNVAILSFILGRQLTLGESAMSALVEAALLHDVGKTKIALDIVNKPGKLTKSERKVIEEHPVRGAEILVETQGLQPLTATVALEHHRTTIGGGYPDLGKGVVPHIMSQIVSVADVYEALTGARSYRAPFPPEKACLVLARGAGDQFNSALVKAFVSAIGFFPLGSLVRTSQGECGVVIRSNPAEPLHPVLVPVDDVLNATGTPIDTSTRDASGVYERSIVETVPVAGRQIDLKKLLEAGGVRESDSDR